MLVWRFINQALIVGAAKYFDLFCAVVWGLVALVRSNLLLRMLKGGSCCSGWTCDFLRGDLHFVVLQSAIWRGNLQQGGCLSMDKFCAYTAGAICFVVN